MLMAHKKAYDCRKTNRLPRVVGFTGNMCKEKASVRYLNGRNL